LQDENQELAKVYRQLFHPDSSIRLAIVLGYVFPPFKALPTRANLEITSVRKTIRATARSVIRSKLDASDKEKDERDILGVMIEENRQNREKGIPDDALSEEEMVDQVMTFLAAGFVLHSPHIHDNSHETTASALTWALYILSKRPDVQERLRKEIHSIHFEPLTIFDQIESLKYLHNFCREVLRFIPPGTGNSLNSD
jgi:cytochrome P450